MLTASMLFSLVSCLIESVILLSLWNVFCKTWIPFRKQVLVGGFHTLALFCRSLSIKLMIASESVTHSFLSDMMTALSEDIMSTLYVSVFTPFDLLLFVLIAFIGFREISATDRLWTALYAYTANELLSLLLGLILPTGLATTWTVYIPFAVVMPLLAFASRRFHVPLWVERQALTLRILCGAILFPFVLWWLFILAAAPFEAVGAAGMEILLLLPYIVFLLGVAVIGALVWVISKDKQRAKLRQTADRMTDLNLFIDESRQNTHDFNKHIRYLRNAVNVYCQQGDTDGLVQDVNTYCEELLERSEKDEILLQLDDSTLRALLYGRRAQATAAGILFILDATPLLPRFPVKNYELVEMVDNLMNNAFDGVLTASNERFIRVILSCEKDAAGAYRHILCIQNPCSPPNMDELLSGRRYTTKSGDHHGVGLAKVSRLTAGTGGKLILGYEDGIFSAKIVYTEHE